MPTVPTPLPGSSRQNPIILKRGESFRGGKVVKEVEYQRQKQLAAGRRLVEEEKEKSRAPILSRTIVVGKDNKQVGSIITRGTRGKPTEINVRGKRETRIYGSPDFINQEVSRIKEEVTRGVRKGTIQIKKEEVKDNQTFYEKLGALQRQSPGKFSTRDKKAFTLSWKELPPKPSEPKITQIGFFDKKDTTQKPKFTVELPQKKAGSETIDYSKQRLKEIKDVQKELRGIGLRFQTIEGRSAVLIDRDKQGFPIYMRVKATEKSNLAKNKQALKVLSERIMNQIDKDRRVRESVDAYRRAEKDMPYSRATFDLAVGFATGVGAAKLFTKIPAKVLTALKYPLKTGTILYVGSVPLRVVSAVSRNGAKGVMTEFAGDIGFVAGFKMGGVPLSTIKNSKVNFQEAKSILKNKFGSKKPSDSRFLEVFKNEATNIGKAKLVKAYYKEYGKLPNIEITTTESGRKINVKTGKLIKRRVGDERKLRLTQ